MPIPYRIRYVARCAGNVRDLLSAARFLLRNDLAAPRGVRLWFVKQIYRISYHIWCAHTEAEILEVATAVLRIPPGTEGVIVEAGSYKGGSAAKLSLLAAITDRRFVAFDSFEGLPENDESNQRSIFGEVPDFSRGKYRGDLEEVKANVGRFGDLSRCTFVKGWFKETMPTFSDPVIVAFLDVDLASSTRTCLKFLFPRLQPNGSIFSQDGHLPRVIELLNDSTFWRDEVGRSRPPMEKRGSAKLVQIVNSNS